MKLHLTLRTSPSLLIDVWLGWWKRNKILWMECAKVSPLSYSNVNQIILHAHTSSCRNILAPSELYTTYAQALLFVHHVPVYGTSNEACITAELSYYSVQFTKYRVTHVIAHHHNGALSRASYSNCRLLVTLGENTRETPYKQAIRREHLEG